MMNLRTMGLVNRWTLKVAVPPALPPLPRDFLPPLTDVLPVDAVPGPKLPAVGALAQPDVLPEDDAAPEESQDADSHGWVQDEDSNGWVRVTNKEEI